MSDINQAVAAAIGFDSQHEWEYLYTEHPEDFDAHYRCRLCSSEVVAYYKNQLPDTGCVPNFAGNLNHAWEAAEKFQAGHVHWSYCCNSKVDLIGKNGGYQALLPYGDHVEIGLGSTPAEAICNAILAAKDQP